MLPKYHLISSVIAALLMAGYFKWLAIFVFIGGFLIDFDHYLHYIFTKKDFSLKKAITYGKIKKLSVDTLHIFHTIEFWFMVALLSVWFKFALATFIGMVVHQALDSFEYYKENVPSPRVKTIYGWIFGMHSKSYYFLKDPRNYQAMLKRGYRDPKEAYNAIKD